MGRKIETPGNGQLDLIPPEGIDWAKAQQARRVWMHDAGGDQGARLEFLSRQGLRPLMADLGPDGAVTLHFYNPRDRETLHLKGSRGESLLGEAGRHFPEAARWMELLESSNDGESEPAASAFLEHGGLLLGVSGGRIRRVYETGREYPQGALRGAGTRQACLLLEQAGGAEGTARAIAFAQALEEARGMKVPVAAAAARAALAEIAGIRGHLMWMGRAAELLGRPGTAGRCGALLGDLEGGMEEWLGDPFGRGWCLPGGLRDDFPMPEAYGMAERLAAVAESWGKLSEAARSLPVPRWSGRRSRRLLEEARKSGWVGPLARTAGLAVDVRTEEPGVYAALGWKGARPPGRGGMLRRMVRIRVEEIRSSLETARRILESPPDGPLLVKRGRGGRGEGFGRCEGPEGEVCCHVILAKGQVAYLAFSFPGELNRSASRCLVGAWLDEADILSLLWETPRQAMGSAI